MACEWSKRERLVSVSQQDLIAVYSVVVVRFFFHFSGHGGRVKDTDGDEDDGYDETIYPVDHDRYQGDSGQIVDDVRERVGISRIRLKLMSICARKCMPSWCVPCLEALV